MTDLPRVPHCPHCLLGMAASTTRPYPAAAERCPHCRLIVGAGRARPEGSDVGDPRARGGAAGVLANAARREEGAAGDPAEVCAAMVHVAEQVGTPVERLRMLDYERASAGSDLPALATVFATFPTWKAARRHARATMDAAGTADEASAGR